MQYLFNSIVLLLCSLFNKYHSFPQNITTYRQYKRGMGISGASVNFKDNINRYTANIRKQGAGVIYQYPVYQRPATITDRNMEYVPGIGNVIIAEQHAKDRFESRPLFSYKNKFPSSSSVQSSSSLLSSSSKSNQFSSVYSSYNPPEFKPDNSPSMYPPFSQSSGVQFQNPLLITSTKTPPTIQTTTDNYASLGPPLALTQNYSSNIRHHHLNYDFSDAHPPYSDTVDDDDPMDSPLSDLLVDDSSNKQPVTTLKTAATVPPPISYDEELFLNDEHQDHHNHHSPPPSPPKSDDDVYYPPDFPKDQIPLNVAASAGDTGRGSDSATTQHSHSIHDYRHSFPEYLYSDHDDEHHYHHHHIYEEVPHTTMTSVKEDKRVSSTHYSYYYLGRKLWYIPLYFSIYFIIYITVLIVKSIARHKVHFKYKWYEHDFNAREGRSHNFDQRKSEELSMAHRNVVTAIDNITDQYVKSM